MRHRRNTTRNIISAVSGFTLLVAGCSSPGGLQAPSSKAVEQTQHSRVPSWTLPALNPETTTVETLYSHPVFSSVARENVPSDAKIVFIDKSEFTEDWLKSANYPKGTVILPKPKLGYSVQNHPMGSELRFGGGNCEYPHEQVEQPGTPRGDLEWLGVVYGYGSWWTKTTEEGTFYWWWNPNTNEWWIITACYASPSPVPTALPSDSNPGGPGGGGVGGSSPTPNPNPTPTATPGWVCPIPVLNRFSQNLNSFTPGYSVQRLVDEELQLSYHTAWESNWDIDPYTGLTREEREIVTCMLNQTIIKFIWDPDTPEVAFAALVISPYMGTKVKSASVICNFVLANGSIRTANLVMPIGKPSQKGRVGEFISNVMGYPKNTQVIEQLFSDGAQRRRVPDHLIQSLNQNVPSVIGDSKATKYLSFTKQLRDDIEIRDALNAQLGPKEMPYEAYLIVPKKTKFSKNLEAAEKAGDFHRIDMEAIIKYDGPLPPKKP